MMDLDTCPANAVIITGTGLVLKRPRDTSHTLLSVVRDPILGVTSLRSGPGGTHLWVKRRAASLAALGTSGGGGVCPLWRPAVTLSSMSQVKVGTATFLARLRLLEGPGHVYVPGTQTILPDIMMVWCHGAHAGGHPSQHYPQLVAGQPHARLQRQRTPWATGLALPDRRGRVQRGGRAD
jgi:hypothetical protein